MNEAASVSWSLTSPCDLQHVHIHYIGTVSSHTHTHTRTHTLTKQAEVSGPAFSSRVVPGSFLLIDCSGGNKINLYSPPAAARGSVTFDSLLWRRMRHVWRRKNSIVAYWSWAVCHYSQVDWQEEIGYVKYFICYRGWHLFACSLCQCCWRDL